MSHTAPSRRGPIITGLRARGGSSLLQLCDARRCRAIGTITILIVSRRVRRRHQPPSTRALVRADAPLTVRMPAYFHRPSVSRIDCVFESRYYVEVRCTTLRSGADTW
ncbi:hypothetical protein EVAR_70871_1 [Eumeta japonica]|uniref:Uncharacterized protein n=1 Tax=Eumeta variegata TaxID=151549 RepID=A0A4C2AEG2_EUMVA|nr:hypothetical protein EVAR_70871_1 [Eumeta japonica]